MLTPGGGDKPSTTSGTGGGEAMRLSSGRVDGAGGGDKVDERGVGLHSLPGVRLVHAYRLNSTGVFTDGRLHRFTPGWLRGPYWVRSTGVLPAT